MKPALIIAIAFFFILALLGGLTLVSYPEVYFRHDSKKTLFKIQSIDTMKYSRDLARLKESDQSFVGEINREMELISRAGATHVAIATPYDEEFIPFLKRWVVSARAHNLAVWFRGNFSGWEGWFGYSRVSRAEHQKKLNDFLLAHMDLFQDGDIFTPCTECENGGPGDPRNTKDVAGFRQFLLDEYAAADSIFKASSLSIRIYNSMNNDVAKYIIDEKTAKALGGTILIDHYVDSAARFGEDLKETRSILKADIGLGEFGAPIPDVNGNMTETEQGEFVSSLLKELYLQNADIPLVNYWVLEGGSTGLVLDGQPRAAYSAIKDYYRMPSLSGVITDTEGKILSGAEIGFTDGSYTLQSRDGFYQIFVPPEKRSLIVKKDGYKDSLITLDKNFATSSEKNILLEPTNKTLRYRLREYIKSYR